jgi:hypothetical protein
MAEPMEPQAGDTTGEDEPTLSRTGMCGPYGPLLSEFKTRVDLDLELEFRRKCAEAGTDVASVLRNWINQSVRGVSYDEAMLHASKSRAQLLGLTGPIQAREGVTA